MGLSALLSQVMLTRELLALFLGNELSIALVLAVWLVGVAVGSTAGAWLAGRVRQPRSTLAWSQVLLAALAPAAILLARAVGSGAVPGEALGPGAVLMVCCKVLGAVSLLHGLQFVLAARAAEERSLGQGEYGVSPVTPIYALEATGSMLAGIAFHCWLAQHAWHLQVAAGVGLLNLSAASWLLAPRRLAAGMPLAALAAGLLVLLVRSAKVEIASLRASPRWSALHPVAAVSSRHGPLVVTREAGQVALYQSGVLLFTSQDHYGNEVAAHLPLLSHPRPRRALIIGGAVAGLAGEALEHPLSRLDCVELDPRVVELAHRWLPAHLLRPLDDPRARLYLGDGRLLVRNAAVGADDRGYDVIIVNMPDPTTAALNRFYTREFFGEAARILNPGGVFCVRLTGAEAYLSPAAQRALATARHTLDLVFAELFMIPGESTYFLASNRGGVLTGDADVLAERLEARGIHTSFVNRVWLQDALLPLRAERLQQSLAREARPRINSDLAPISYYYQSLIWLEQLSPWLADLAQRGMRARACLAAVPIAAVLAWLAAHRRNRWLARAAPLVAAGAIGAFGLMTEVVCLLAFQSACGYLYHALGALVASFMAGLALGSWLMGGRRADQRALGRLLVASLATGALMAALLPYLLASLLGAPRLAPVALAATLALAGSLVGAVFPVASAIYREQRSGAAAGGAIYAADLVGSAGGAAVAGTAAVPLLGMQGTAFATALLLAVALVLALPVLRARA